MRWGSVGSRLGLRPYGVPPRGPCTVAPLSSPPPLSHPPVFDFSLCPLCPSWFSSWTCFLTSLPIIFLDLCVRFPKFVSLLTIFLDLFDCFPKFVFLPHCRLFSKIFFSFFPRLSHCLSHCLFISLLTMYLFLNMLMLVRRLDKSVERCHINKILILILMFWMGV